MATTYEILTASKEHDEAAIRTGIAEARPGFKIEAIVDEGDEWTIRIAADDEDKPDFLKKKDDVAEDSADDKDTEDSESEDSEDGKDKKGNPAEAVKKVIDELTGLFADLGGHVDELQASHDEKDQALKDIADTAGANKSEGEDGLPPLPEDLKDLPEGPGKAPVPPRAAPIPGGAKRPGPGGRSPTGIPTFTNVEVANHPGVDDAGNRLSLSQVVAAFESDEEFQGYQVVGLAANRDGSYSAKLGKPKS